MLDLENSARKLKCAQLIIVIIAVSTGRRKLNARGKLRERLQWKAHSEARARTCSGKRDPCGHAKTQKNPLLRTG